MDLLNNWLIQVVLGNIAWNLLCKIVNYFKNYFQQLNKNTSQSSNATSNNLYPIDLLKKQYNACSKISSACVVLIVVILINNLLNSEFFYSLFIFSIIIIFLCYILMLGAFEGVLRHLDK